MTYEEWYNRNIYFLVNMSVKEACRLAFEFGKDKREVDEDSKEDLHRGSWTAPI